MARTLAAPFPRMSHQTLADILTWPVVTVTPEQPVSDALALMRSHRISALAVIENNRPVGIFTERNAVQLAARHDDASAVPVGEVMGQPPLTAPREMDYRSAYQLMTDRHVRHLLVVDEDGLLAGIVSEGNFLDHLGFEYLLQFREVSAVMSRDILNLPEDANAREAVQLMARHQVSCIVVERDSRAVGILTERDVVRLGRDGIDVGAKPLAEVMSHPVETVAADESLDATIQHMHEAGIRRLVVTDADGRVVGLVTRHDLTKVLYGRHIDHLRDTISHLREELAREPDRRFRYLIDYGADAVMIVDARNGRILECNDGACRLLGYARHELLTLRVEDFAAIFAHTTWPEVAARFKQAGHTVLETEDRRKDGSLVPVEVSARYMEDEPHDYVIATVRDISQRKRTERDLAEREAQLTTLIEAVPDSIQFKDGQGRWRLANSVALRLFGLAGKAWQGLSDEEIARRHPDQAACLAACRASDEAAWLSRRPFRTEETLTDAAGQPARIDIIKVPLFNADGRRRALAVVGRDVTESKQAEERRRLAASVFQSSREGITITDPDANIIDVNEAFSRITGYARDEVLGRNPRILKSGFHDEAFYQAMWRSIREDGYWSGEIWNRRKDGSNYPELLTISTVRDDAGAVSHYVAVFTDITVIKQHEKQLEHIAHYDALTGIPNRMLLADRMGQAIARTRRDGGHMAVGYLDLDGFKPINDRFGHDVGDRLLVEIARRLKATLRGADTVARLGGDEFVFLLLDLDHAEEYAATLNRVLAAIVQPVLLPEQSISVSASIGVTLYPLDDADPDTLLRHADQAMYQAKQAGRNRYHLYDPESDRRARSHQEAFSRIRQALEDGEFELHYQPKVHMRSGRVVGAEALIRWNHPERGLVAPGDFLPVIENSELDVAVGHWVLRTALAQAAAWQQAGFDLQVGINISAHHLQQDDFAQRLAELLAAHPPLPTGRVQLEVLETAALEDMIGVSQVMDLCRARGIGFALDDFGTGYSSLTYLKRLPVETLKIDQSFVRDILEDLDDLAIVEGVMALAKAFGRTTVAEGVETAAHGLLLLDLGCELAQGYGIARPMPAAALPAWMASWRADPRWLGKTTG